jgi:hypothetical protein
MDKANRPEIGRRKGVLCDGVDSGWRTVREDAGVADIDAGLPAEFGPEANRVKKRTGEGLVGEISLVEDVVAIGCVLISAEIVEGVGGVYRPGQRAAGG